MSRPRIASQFIETARQIRAKDEAGELNTFEKKQAAQELVNQAYRWTMWLELHPELKNLIGGDEDPGEWEKLAERKRKEQ